MPISAVIRLIRLIDQLAELEKEITALGSAGLTEDDEKDYVARVVIQVQLDKFTGELIELIRSNQPSAKTA